MWYNPHMEAIKEKEEKETGGKIVATEGWSWGAFLFGVPFLVGIKKYKMLWWLLLALVPFVNVVFWIAFIIYLGLKGHELEARSPQFSNQDEYDGFFKVFDHAGKILTIAVIVISVIFLLFGFSVTLNNFFFGHAPHHHFW